jgi:hypothetical protein
VNTVFVSFVVVRRRSVPNPTADSVVDLRDSVPATLSN